MELLYKLEHLNCLNYDHSKKPLIELITRVKCYHWELFTTVNTILFAVKGKITFSFGQYSNKTLTAHQMIVLPVGDSCCGHADEDCELILIRLRDAKSFCDCYSLNAPLQEISNDFNYDLEPFPTNPAIDEYLSFLKDRISDGIKCTFFLEMKMQELLYLLRYYYTKEELLRLFYPILSQDLSFSDFIIKNYKQTKTVKELADMLHYSLSGFQKRFKKVFGIPAYQWMIEQRLKSIYHEINTSDKTLKEISDEFGFSSPSHFNDFCKLNFGATPGKLRKKLATPHQRTDRQDRTKK